MFSSAGASADSGLPTFASMLNYSDSASLDNLFRNSVETQTFWAQAGDMYTQATPHECYEVIRQLCARQISWGRRALNITTNIDGMARTSLQQEPVVATSVIELHDPLREWQCGGVRNDASRYLPNSAKERCSTDLFSVAVVREEISRRRDNSSDQSTSTCAQGIIRPHGVFFGDGNKNLLNDTDLQGHDKWVEFYTTHMINQSRSGW